jgi:hypothetical protein
VSTEGSGKADSSQNANDGVPNPKVSGGSCAQTKGVNVYEWWMVDMNDYYNIKRVIIANSADHGGTLFYCIMFTPARDFLLETPWRIIIPNPNVNSHSL